ncbi:MAG TPA: DUF1475 family protein [Anaerolineales bacterium]|nr:DUF1475 family protein [Anaerolineales bacterium]
MKIANLVAWLGLMAMTLVLIFAFTQGDFFTEGARLLSMPWGIVSMVDLYVGFTLFSAWIIYREKSIMTSVVWVILMMILGFFTASLYIILALRRSGGNWMQFWMGKNYPGQVS